jgi:tRNA (mo5U34)-methyltransferase
MGTGMTNAELQARIDAVQWYHEYDFGNGLRATSRIENVEGVRNIWCFIEGHLDRIDFSGKSVLEIGTWDGYWSFYAERRGAAPVVATDDATQNWAGAAGLRLAHELFKSRVEVREDVPIYELTKLNRTFDIILCLGVFYHLRDPLYGFAQMRHCCHRDTIVIVEGELGWNGMYPNEARYFYNAWLEFLPTQTVLEGLLKLAYFRVDSVDWMHPFPTAPSPRADVQSDRAFFVCRPFDGTNKMYVYRPHFGLHVFDERFRADDAAPARPAYRVPNEPLNKTAEGQMNKPVFAMLLGGVLGIFDGLTALISAPQEAPNIAGIVFGSTIKGVIAGLIIGLVAQRTQSLVIGIVVGLAVGAALAALVTIGTSYFWEIVLPGSLVGLIVGFATFKYAGVNKSRAATR